MDYMKQCAQLTQKYLKEVKHQDITIDAILERPRWKQVWFYWKSLEHYEGKPLPMSLQDCQRCYED